MCFDSMTKLFCSAIDIGDRRESFYFGKWVRWERDFVNCSSSTPSDDGSTGVVVPKVLTPVTEELLLGVRTIKSSSI